MRQLWRVLWIFTALLGSIPAHAGAIKGVITAVEAPLFERASESSRVTEVLKAGEAISLNEEIRQGFYYGRARSGALGWVRVLDVRIVGRFDEAPAGGAKSQEKGASGSKEDASRKPRPWRVLVGYGLNGFAHSDIAAQSEEGILEAGGSSFTVEANYLPQPQWALGVRFSRLSQSLELICTDASLIETECTFKTSAFEALTGARFRTALSEMVRFEVGGFAGFAFGTSVRVTEASGGFSEISGLAFATHLDAAIEIELSRKMSLFGQIGYHLVKGAQAPPVVNTATVPPDSALFEDPAAVDLSGLAVMFGVGFRLPW